MRPGGIPAGTTVGRRASLLRFTDRLFGDGEAPIPDPSVRWWARYLGVAILLAAILIVRRRDTVTNPQFFGEDGFLFFRDDLLLGLRAIPIPYAGFPQLGQRLIGALGGLVPIASAPRVYTTIAIAVTAFGLASFVLPGFRHLVRSDPLRLLWCVAAACVPIEEGMPPVPHGGILGSPSNLGWWVAIWVSLLSLMQVPRSRLRLALLTLGGSLAIFTTPLAGVNLPLWLLRGWHGRRRSRPRDVVFAVTLLAAYGLLILSAGALGAGHGLPISLFGGPASYLRRFLELLPYRVTALVLPPPWLEDASGTGLLAIVAVAALACAGLAVLGVAARQRNLPSLGVVLGLVLASLFVSTIGRGAWTHVPLADFPARYTVFPAAMLVLAVVIVLDGLPAGASRRGAVAGAVLLLVWAWWPRFVLPPLEDLDWPRWADALEGKLESGSRAPLYIPMNPRWAPLSFDAAAFASEANVAPEGIIAGLGPNGTFRQRFLPRCDGLAGVEIQLAVGMSSTQGTLRMSLLDPTGTVVAEHESPRGEVLHEGHALALWFDPVAGSADRRYTIVVQAVDNTMEATVYVLGAPGDPYPDGEALLGRSVLDGDASFRYACAMRPLPTAEQRPADAQEIVPQASGLRRK
jgi:hypothetical protein